MTTVFDDLEDRIASIGPITLELGLEQDITVDPTGVFPRFQEWYQSTISQVSTGAAYTALNLGGGFQGIQDAIGEPVPSQRTRNRAVVTTSGHSLEMDDTPGNERIILRHNTGNGVEVRPNGSMIISAGQQIISVTQDQKIIIEGNATIVYGGNVDMEVAGDYNLNVKGNYNLSVGENRNENVEGAYRTTTEGNQGHTIKGNVSNTVLGTTTNTILGDNNHVVKGAARYTSEGNMQIASGGTTRISAKTNLFQSSSNMNIAASDLSVFGVSGTFGGENVVMYGKGATFGEGVTAPTFTGDLTGRADEAIRSDTAQLADGASIADALGTAPAANGWTNTDTATPTTSQPNTAILNNYLNNTPYGTVSVSVDIGNHFRRAINRADATSGLSTRDLSTSEIRALMRTEGVRNDANFVGNAVASGNLSSAYAQSTPPPIVRVAGRAPTPYRGNNPVGRSAPGSDGRFLAPDSLTTTSFTPNIPITFSTEISRTTPLADGVYLSRYIGAQGFAGRLSQIPVRKRQQIARNLQPNAEIFRRIVSNRDEDFREHRLRVAEGVYNPTDAEQAFAGWADSVNKFRSEGRAAVYEFLDSNGLIDVSKTFDLAVYLKTVTVFEKLILDYDTYDVDGSLNAQIIIIMPELSPTYEVSNGSFAKDVETRYNGSVMSSSDLLEVEAPRTRDF